MMESAVIVYLLLINVFGSCKFGHSRSTFGTKVLKRNTSVSKIYLSLMPLLLWVTDNLFPNDSWFSCVCSKSLLKTLWEKKKLLVTSNFSLNFPSSSSTHMENSVNPFENTMGKEEIAPYEQFLLFPLCFLPIWRTFCHLHQNLKSLSTNSFDLKSLIFAVWERLNTVALVQRKTIHDRDI